MEPPTCRLDGQSDDAVLIQRLRGGDGAALDALVRRHHLPLQRFARGRAPDPGMAEDVVQDTWLAVVRGIHAYEGRSTFRTWLYSILLNRLRSRLRAERRFVPLPPGTGAFVEPETTGPEARVLGAELLRVIDRAITGLPPSQRTVIRLRDVDGCTADEACSRLGITPVHQRVLLHRARVRVRSAVRGYWLAG